MSEGAKADDGGGGEAAKSRLGRAKPEEAAHLSLFYSVNYGAYSIKLFGTVLRKRCDYGGVLCYNTTYTSLALHLRVR